MNKTLLAGLLLLISPLSATASTLPKVDAPSSSLSLGSAPALGLDIALGTQSTLGASFAAPFYYGSNFGITRYDVRYVHRFVNQENFSVGGIVGVYGDIDFFRNSGLPLSGLGLELGIAIAYRFTDQLTGRVNIVPGIGFLQSNGGFGLFPPAGGLELAWRFSPNLEGSLGFNGNGDIAGLRLIF
jgi:hypothetical protein